MSEEKDKEYSKKNKGYVELNWWQITLITLSIIVVLIGLGFTVRLIIENDVISKGSNDGWLSFFGSYLGGAFSGVMTIIVLFVTITQTRKIQEENKKENQHYQFENAQLTQSIQHKNEIQNKEIQEENMKFQFKQMDKVFTNDIANHVATYITDINVYFWNVRRKEEANRVKAVEMFYILHIKLDNIDGAKQLLRCLDRIHEIYCFAENIENTDDFKDECDALKEKTTEFINNYSSYEMNNY